MYSWASQQLGLGIIVNIREDGEEQDRERQREKTRERKREEERCQLFYPHLEIVGVYEPRDRPAEFTASAENLNPSEPGKKKRPSSRSARHETAAAR